MSHARFCLTHSNCRSLTIRHVTLGILHLVGHTAAAALTHYGHRVASTAKKRFKLK